MFWQYHDSIKQGTLLSGSDITAISPPPLPLLFRAENMILTFTCIVNKGLHQTF